MSIELVKDYVPAPWIGLVQVKSQYYKGAAHQLVGRGLYQHEGALDKKTQETLGFLYATDSPNQNVKISTIIDIRIPKDDIEKQQLGIFQSSSIIFLVINSVESAENSFQNRNFSTFTQLSWIHSKGKIGLDSF